MDYVAGTSLSGRAVSGFPLSIGTSLALESIFSPQQSPYDPDRPIPQQIDLAKYHTFWVNVTTLYRNLVGAISKEAYQSVSAEEICMVLEEEMDVINLLFQNEGQNLCKVCYYYGTYESLEKEKTPGFGLRKPTTPSQIHYHGLLEHVLKLLQKRTDTIQVFKDAVKAKRRDRALILTHQPYDLTDYKHFERLDLLESNTGVLKPRALWSTKYNPMSGVSFSNIPFTRKLLMVFGDRSLIHPIGPLRKVIIEVAEKNKWTAVTTDEKVSFDFNRSVRDPYAIAVFKEL